MVKAEIAREDIDNFCLTKTISYLNYSTTKTSLAKETVDRRSTPTTYSILAQVTVQNISTKWVANGVLAAGDLVGLFRYEYTAEADGSVISPTLVPKINDEIVFNSQNYVIKSCTPATSEESAIIGWDYTAALQK